MPRYSYSAAAAWAPTAARRARSRIGHYIILDKDVIAPSNINRQAIAFRSTIGKRKVDVMEAMIHDINPAASVIKRSEYLFTDNIDEFFASVLEQPGGKLDTSSWGEVQRSSRRELVCAMRAASSARSLPRSPASWSRVRSSAKAIWSAGQGVSSLGG